MEFQVPGSKFQVESSSFSFSSFCFREEEGATRTTAGAPNTVSAPLRHSHGSRRYGDRRSVLDSKAGDAGWKTDTTPVADVATQLPTTANGGISDGGLTYTFHIKPGVDWQNGRQVTSYDFLREYQAFGNPVSPVGNSGYFLSTIQGFAKYFNGETAYFSTKSHAPTAANIANYQNTHTISGITTPNSSTIVFHLIQPAADFLYILAMPFNSARPVEYDSYVPDSAAFRQHLMSDGPYKLSSYVPGKSVVWVRNPAWKQSTDSVRHQYVSKIVDTIGVTDATTQVDEIKAGTEDLQQDTVVPAAAHLQLPEQPGLPCLEPERHRPVHRVQPAEPGREPRDGQAACAPGG